jgi:integrase
MKGVFRLLEVCRTPQEKALVAFCGLAGLRVAEACSVRPEDVDIEGRVILVYNGKGGKTRRVPLTTQAGLAMQRALAEAVARDLPTVVGMTEDQARKLITRLGKRAGLARPIASHDLRATLATASYRRSGDLLAVQEILGHSDPKTTRIYIEESFESMAEAMDHHPDDEEQAS